MTDEEKRAKRAAYMRAWSRANRDKIRAYREKPEVKARDAKRERARHEADPTRSARLKRADREVNPEKYKAIQAARYNADPERYKVEARAWYAANKERGRERTRQWIAAHPGHNAAWTKTAREADPEKYRERYRVWRLANLARKAANTRARDALRLQATPAWADPSAIREFYIRSAQLTKETGIMHQVDHIVPLKSKRVCGLHCPANLRVIARSENARKKDVWWPDDCANPILAAPG